MTNLQANSTEINNNVATIAQLCNRLTAVMTREASALQQYRLYAQQRAIRAYANSMRQLSHALYSKDCARISRATRVHDAAVVACVMEGVHASDL